MSRAVAPSPEHPPPSSRPWLTTAEAAAHAHVSEKTVIRWCERYGLLGRLVGGRWRIDAGVLEAILQGEADGGRRHGGS